MRKLIYDFYGEKLLREEIADPVHGKDFCDRCGDCLDCYGDDPCSDGGDHVWIEYEDSTD